MTSRLYLGDFSKPPTKHRAYIKSPQHRQYLPFNFGCLLGGVPKS